LKKFSFSKTYKYNFGLTIVTVQLGEQIFGAKGANSSYVNFDRSNLTKSSR
jgi:hypothetical protein